MKEAPTLGGMALPNGVLLRLPDRWAWAIRTREGIRARALPVPPPPPYARLPLVRGLYALATAYRAAAAAFADSLRELLANGPQLTEKETRLVTGLSLVLGILAALLLFVALPGAMAAGLAGRSGPLAVSLLAGFLKFSLLAGYVLLLNRFHPLWKETLRYHGAEHQIIAAIERGEEATADAAERQSPYHPRCGTAYLALSFLLAVLVFALLPAPASPLAQALGRLALLPALLGLSYEIFAWVGKHPEHPLARLLLAPGLAFQRLTVHRPGREHLEVAVAAARAALTS